MDLGHWILDENLEPVAVELMEWAQWCEDFENRRIAKTEFVDSSVVVSTVFLGIDYGAFTDEDEPVLFETLVQDGMFDGSMDRYTTYDAAVIGHQAWVHRILLESDGPTSTKSYHVKKRPKHLPRKLEYSNETTVSVLKEKIVRKVIR